LNQRKKALILPYVEKLKMIKEEKGLTNLEISTLSNIPLPTITRIFNGHTPNPTFETISQITIALGASLDEITGLKQPEEQPIASPIENTLNSYSELLKEKDDRIKELKEDKSVIRNEKYKLVGMLIALVVVLVALVAILVWVNIDIRNGNIGRVRY
jgi:transcriptional regulator with XRE-family HTH domain